MEKPKFHLNPNEEIVKTIREGLKRTGGYCPCRLQHIPENICICKEFKEQLADPDYHGACHCGLYVKDRGFFPFTTIIISKTRYLPRKAGTSFCLCYTHAASVSSVRIMCPSASTSAV